MEFKDRLKIALGHKNLKKYRLAKLIGCPEATARSWFNGKIPRTSYMNELCRVLEVSPAWLQYGEEEHGPTLNNRALALVEKITFCGEEALIKMDQVFEIWYGEKYRSAQLPAISTWDSEKSKPLQKEKKKQLA